MSLLDRKPSIATTPPRADVEPAPPALVRLIRLMLLDLGVGLVVAAVTWLAHGAIVDHQVAHVSGQSRQSLSITLWSRPSVSVVVALLYPLFIRRLRRRERRGWRRTIIVSCLQVVGLSWYALGSGYPWWLSVLVGLQALAAVAVVVSATRAPVRTLFGYSGPTAAGRAGHRAALVLVVLAPLVAEVSWGSTRASQLYGVLLYWPAYGAGVLLVREIVRRRGGGLPSVLLLGAAYGVVEEGICLQSLTSTSLFPSMSGLSPQIGGVNTAYTVMVLCYHAVFSVAVPIALAERLAPRAVEGRLWLGRPGLIVTGVVLVLGFGLLRLIPLTADPDYVMPWAWDVAFGVLAVLLVVAGLRFPRRRRMSSTDSTRTSAPRPSVIGASSLLATIAFLSPVMPLFGAHRAGFAPSDPTSFVAVAVSLLVLILTAMIARRWAVDGLTSRQRLAALTGALAGHTLIGLASLVHRPVDIGFLGVVGVAEVGLMLALMRRTSAVEEQTESRDVDAAGVRPAAT